MSSTKVWHPLPSFSASPKLTFFGQDKTKSHCFTLPKATNPDYISHFGLKTGFLQTKIVFDINGISYPAEIRLAIIDRSRPYKLNPEDLPKREVLLFQWKNFKETQKAMRENFNEAFNDAKIGSPNPNFILNFHHLSDEIFTVRISKDESKPLQYNKLRLISERKTKTNKSIIKSPDIRAFIDELSIKLGTDNITRLEGQRSVYVINNKVALYLKISRKVQFWGVSENVRKKLKQTHYRIFIGLIDGDIERTFIIPLDDLDDYFSRANLAKDGSFKLSTIEGNYISIRGSTLHFDGNEYLNNYVQLVSK
jgi:hypothetical protein